MKRGGNQVAIVDTQTRHRVDQLGRIRATTLGRQAWPAALHGKVHPEAGRQALSVSANVHGNHSRVDRGDYRPTKSQSRRARYGRHGSNLAGEWTLFNGRDLAGWTAVDAGGFETARQFWTVRDGVLHGDGGANGTSSPHLHDSRRLRLTFGSR